MKIIGKVKPADIPENQRGKSSKKYIDRLVNRNLLTPYSPNGKPKKRIGGKYPGGATSYDYKQFKNITL